MGDAVSSMNRKTEFGRSSKRVPKTKKKKKHFSCDPYIFVQEPFFKQKEYGYKSISKASPYMGRCPYGVL